MNSIRIGALLVAAILLWSPDAHSTTVMKVGLSQLTQSSALIFHGRVERVVTRDLGTQGRHRILTHTRFTVLDVLKGDSSLKHVDLVQPGGTVAGYRLEVPGMPRFAEGDEVVLFLEWRGRGYAVCGAKQGVFRVVSGADGTRVVQRETDGMSLLVASDTQPDPDELRQRPLPLSEFFDVVRHLIQPLGDTP